jgi:hypothetical protein
VRRKEAAYFLGAPPTVAHNKIYVSRQDLPTEISSITAEIRIKQIVACPNSYHSLMPYLPQEGVKLENGNEPG